MLRRGPPSLEFLTADNSPEGRSGRGGGYTSGRGEPKAGLTHLPQLGSAAQSSHPREPPSPILIWGQSSRLPRACVASSD